MNLFVDTSALVKLYHREIGTDNFINSLHRQDNLVITMTDISRVECHSALMKRVRIGKLSLKNAREALTFFEQLSTEAEVLAHFGIQSFRFGYCRIKRCQS